MNKHSGTVRLFALLLWTAISGSALIGSEAGLGTVDFRYSLPWWQTAICLPDDPDKPLVGKEGQCLFDFGGGGVRNFGLCVQPEIREGTKWVRQETLSARVPIVRTFKESEGVEVLEEVFVATPQAGAVAPRPRVLRLDGTRRLQGWAKPQKTCAPAFTGVDVSFGGPGIQLQITAPREAATIVLGFCEGWHKEPGKRPLVIAVEGGEPRTVDPGKDFGANVPGLYRVAARDVNGDGSLDVKVSTPEGTTDRNAILNVLWVFAGETPPDEQILSGEADGRAFAVFAGGAGPERKAVVIMRLKNPGGEPVKRQPMLRVEAVSPARFAPEEGAVRIDATRLTASERIEACEGAGTPKCLIRLEPVQLAPGATREIVFTIDRHQAEPGKPLTAAAALELRETARRWWESADLPYNAIQVPDPGVQAMLESCVRNIWQAREIRNGKPAFHVGPTVYRGLWVVDGAFLLESAALVDRAQDARAGIEYLLSHQKPDGSFELLPAYWKENGIVLWTATRHAQLTQDKDWLRAQWPVLRRVVQAIKNLRAKTIANPDALEHGLFPGGEVDGGISNPPPKSAPEFSNVYWSLAGLKAIIAAAHWLGEETDATEWQREYDSFYEAARKAMSRDTLKDSHGNEYVPTMMGNGRKLVPQKGQWAFCQAIYPGQVFPADDPLVRSQVQMLRDTKAQGMVFDTGWMAQGIWTYFASFYGHAVLWQGQGREAAEMLYDFARHACPTRLWREEQKPVGKGGQEVGDMPHNWASAEFIRLTAHLLQLDRGNELHLLEGFPREWAGAGMTTRLNGMPTPFGRLQFEVRITEDGRSARIKMGHLTGRKPDRILLHLDGLTGVKKAVELPTGQDLEQTFSR